MSLRLTRKYVNALGTNMVYFTRKLVMDTQLHCMRQATLLAR